MNVLSECLNVNEEYVFCYKGKPVLRTPTKAFKKACERAGITDLLARS